MKAIVMCAALAACGGGGGAADNTKYIGTYSTTSHVSAQGAGARIACTTAGDPVTDARPFFRIEVDPFFMDDTLLTLVDCNDAAATDCADTLVTLMAGGPGLEYESASSQTGGGAMCNLYYSHQQATLDADGVTVHVESLDKFDSPNISASDCTVERAETLADSPDCQMIERWVGTRI